MLTIKTKVAKSTIPDAGNGLFADEFIPKGTLVWKFDEGKDLRISKEVFYNMPPKQQDFTRTYGYSKGNLETITLPMDDAKYVNNSDSPNIYGETDDVSYAIKDINIGDEIVEDYSAYDDGNW